MNESEKLFWDHIFRISYEVEIAKPGRTMPLEAVISFCAAAADAALDARRQRIPEEK